MTVLKAIHRERLRTRASAGAEIPDWKASRIVSGREGVKEAVLDGRITCGVAESAVWPAGAMEIGTGGDPEVKLQGQFFKPLALGLAGGRMPGFNTVYAKAFPFPHEFVQFAPGNEEGKWMGDDGSSTGCVDDVYDFRKGEAVPWHIERFALPDEPVEGILTGGGSSPGHEKIGDMGSSYGRRSARDGDEFGFGDGNS